MHLTLISILAHVLLLVCSNLLLGYVVLAETGPFGLRLTSGRTEFEGRLEIEYSLDQWGSICDDRWDWPATFVVCNQLALGPPLDHLFEVPTDFSIPIAYDNVVCQGNETRLIDCSHDGVRNHDCTHEEDVTIHCAPPTGDSDYAVETVRNINSNLNSLDIFTLIYYKTFWFTLCHSNWSPTDADVLCHQLGFSQPNTRVSFTTSLPPIFQSYECLAVYPVCKGTENHLRECEWFDARPSSSPAYLLIDCEADILSTGFNSTEGTNDSRRLSPMLTIFLVLFGVVVLLVLICKLFQKVQCKAGCCKCWESQTTQEQEPQIRVVAIRSLDEDDDISLYAERVTEIQELPDDIPPSYDQYVTNPDLFRTFSEVRRSEGLDSNSQVEDSVDSPPPDYDSATFGFSVDENQSESSFGTRL